MVDPRPAKKARPIADPPQHAGPSNNTPRLFAPFRALGLVCNALPFAMFVHTPSGALAQPTVSLVTSVGTSWMMWDMAGMTLVFVSPDADEELGGLAMTGTEIFASTGGRVRRYLRGKEANQYEAPKAFSLGKLVLFGDQVLAMRQDGSGLCVWDKQSAEVVNEIEFHASFQATAVLHPATYLNKILVGSEEGELQIWNTRTASLVHSFHRFTTIPTAVTAMVQSPAVDVVAVGYEDGTIQIIDIRLGELVMKMRNDDGGVTALSFRMDGPPVFATASTSGSIALWDLSKEGRLIHVQRMAHEQAVSALEWVSGQPLLISSSGDNSVKQWVFDSPTSVPRLLKFRSGHHAPPSCIRFFGEDGKQLLTSGKDRSLRYTSVVRDSRSHELSQGSIAKRAYANQVSADSLKASPIISMSSSSTRSKDWEDVLTAHAEDGVAKTWRVQDKRIGPWSFEVESGDVQAVCVTACGNFGLVGSSTGEIRMWNMQSGKDRRSFSLTGPAPGDTKASDTQRRPKKQVNGAGAKRSLQAITGLVADTLNTMVIASTLQGGLYFFDFHTTRLLHKLDLPTSVTSLTLQRESGLLAAVCDDLAVRLVDIETKRVVRELRGFGGRILDIAFSADSRWILASSLDSVIRTFDIPTGQLVDAFRTRTLATSMAFSPTGDFLATAHVDSLGVHLWANRAQFTDIAVRHIKEEDDMPEIGLPSVQGLGENADIGDLEPIGAPEFFDVYTTPDQLEESLMTLSLLPRSRWQTLLNLETIRLRNKPKEPPKAPEKAPFFLPTVAGLETRFDVSTAPSTADADTHRLVPSSSMESPFTRRLTAAVEEGEHAEFFEYAKSLSPSALDLEIRSLSSLDHMAAFLETLTMRLRSHRDFEAVQALMSVFLTVHADVLIANAELKDSLVQLREEQRKESSRLSGLMGFAMGTLSFLRVSG